MKRCDVLVVGAGLLGVFAARALCRYPLEVCVAEKASDVCTGISKANSAIVYSGCDAVPDTLKAALCVPACADFGKLCAELGVRFDRCGSLLVCTGAAGEASVRKKYAQGRQNGVQGLELLSDTELLKTEPGLSPDVRMGLYAPGAGTVEPWELGIAAFENASENGAKFFFGAEVKTLSRRDGHYYAETERETFCARCVINCAGLHAAALREMLLPPYVGIRFSLADFAVYDESLRGLVRHVLMQEREDGTKGVTLVPTTDGNLLAESPVKVRTESAAACSTPEGQAALDALSRELVPALDAEKVIRRFAAVRPNPYYIGGSRRSIDSFVCLGEDGLISLIGIKTPGLTCAEALGRHAAEKAAAFLGVTGENPHFSPVRTPPVRLTELDAKARNALIASDGSYGRIVCRCRGVSEGEILNAIRAGARTVSGVKRRCGAGMGRCQGGFCTAQIAKLLARETGKAVEEVLSLHD